MHIVFIGTDRKIFENGSATRARHALLGSTFPNDTFTSIVFSTERHGFSQTDAITANVHAIPTNSRSRLHYGYDAIRIAKRLLRPDVVSTQDPFETGLAGLMIARHFQVPLTVEAHTDLTTDGYARHSLLNRIRLALAKVVIPRAAGGYAVSAHARDSIAKRYKLQRLFAILPIYVDTSRYASLPRTPRPGELLWVGRLEPEKRPLAAIEAVAAAHAAGEHVHLTILGEGSLRSELEYYIETNDLREVVTLAGWGDPAAYLPSTELMLVTSAYEGYGMAMVEALAAGVPVLATDVGVAREAGAIVTNGSYADALRAWFAGPRERGVLMLPSYASAQEYASKIREFYAAFT